MTDARWANGGRKQTVYWSVEYVDQCRKGKGLDQAGASASDSPARWRNGFLREMWRVILLLREWLKWSSQEN